MTCFVCFCSPALGVSSYDDDTGGLCRTVFMVKELRYHFLFLQCSWLTNCVVYLIIFFVCSCFMVFFRVCLTLKVQTGLTRLLERFVFLSPIIGCCFVAGSLSLLFFYLRFFLFFFTSAKINSDKSDN